VLVVAAYLSACCLFVYLSVPSEPSAHGTDTVETVPLERILSSGILTAIIPNNAHCYHLYREEAMGLEYELVHAFAGFLGVDLRISSADSWQEMLRRLETGEGDLVAAGMPPLPNRDAAVLFSEGHLATSQQLVLRKGNRKIGDAADLAGKTVHVARGSVYQETLERFQQEGIDVRIVLVDGVTTEELIRRVADGEIPATLAYDHILRINRRYYPRAVGAGAVKGEERLVWAVPAHARRLLEQIDDFFKEINDSGRLSEIYKRYYAVADSFEYLDARMFERRLDAHLPKYRELIEQSASAYGFDWRLIAAQIYQESHFDPQALSPAGAGGLMQLTPATAEAYELSDISDPGGNIEAGVAYLKYLFDTLEGPIGQDRLKIALASYNIGLGHVLDARELARKQGLDPDRWSSLEKTLPLLADPRYYRNAQHGYCRGSEPVRYVKRVLFYYDILKRHHLDSEACDPRNLSAIREIPPEGSVAE
jgi:membrane-bound lytic murein transglycosylase F